MLSLLLLTGQIATEPATTASSVDFTWLFIKMLLILIIICILAVVILKFGVPRLGLFKPFQKGRFFHVLGCYRLEPKKSLYLVNIGKRYLVLGAADHGINLLTEISQEEAEGAT